ncbi:MAG: DNA primase [Gammaproteobacteria bacterium]
MAGRIPDQFIDDLIARTDIVELIEAHLPLRKAGREFQALCPFHGEKTPSFTVSREKQFYHCFGCGAHGTAIGFLMNYRNLDFREAVEELAQAAGMEIPLEARSQRPAGTREVYAALETARRYYEQALRQAEDRARAVDYLKGRGVSGAVAKQFRLGYAPPGWRNLFDALVADGVDETVIERAGLAIRRDRGGYYDRFRERVMFPIHDRRGRVIGFGGRILDSGEPKYLNSPETDVFHKGRELYGLHEVLTAGGADSLVVVEGYMDVIALHQFGMANAVATLGTACTPEHLDLLFRHVPLVSFCFDGDAAGRRAAWKAVETALPKLEGNREVRFQFLPEGHDPDTAVREFGADGFFDAGENAGLTEFLLATLAADVDLATSTGRTRLVAAAQPYLRQVPDETHRAAAARRLAELTRFDEDLVRRELGIGRRRTAQTAAPTSLGRYTSRSLQEQALALMLQYPTLAGHLDEASAAVLAELEGCAILLGVWRVAAAGVASPAALVERFRGEPAEALLLELSGLDLNLTSEGATREFADAVARLRTRAEDARIKRIREIPFSEWTDEQKALMRDYRRGSGERSGPQS